MFTFLEFKNFLTSKLGLEFLYCLLILALIIFVYNKVYDIGYNKAKAEYAQALNIELSKRAKVSEIVVQKAELTATQEEKIKVVYKDRIQEVEKIVEKQIYKECAMSDEDYEVYKKAMEEVK